MAQSALIVSPVGRWIGGSMTDQVKTDYENKPLDPDKFHYSIAVAFRKDDPKTGEMLQAIAAHAFAEFAQAPHIQALIGQYNFGPNAGFSWKVKDGDVPNLKGQLNENSKGCYVIYFSSNFITKTSDQQNAEIGTDVIKRGSFIQVAFSCAGNTKVDRTAGIYINPQVYRFVAFGEAIIGGVDAATAFAGHDLPANLPPGASLTPVASQMSMPPAGVPVSPVPGQPPMQQGLPGAQPTAPLNTPLTTGYPIDPATGQPAVAPGMPVAGVAPVAPGMPVAGVIDPATGQPIQPHPTFAGGPVA